MIDSLLGKYGLFFEGQKRFYIEDLTKRDLTLECTIPVSFSFNSVKIECTSWKSLLPKIANEMLDFSPKTTEELLTFRVSWTKQKIFTTTKVTNSEVLKNGLFLACNFTADHSAWIIQDLISFFHIDLGACKMIIRRPPFAEPEEIKELLIQQQKDNFSTYLRETYSFTSQRIMKIISNIDVITNAVLPKITKSYNNIWLFDMNQNAYNYIVKLEEYAEEHYLGKEKLLRQIKRYCLFLKDFYKVTLN